MKKLISMLAATSLVVTAPLSVVACKSKENQKNDFDYSQLINDFLALSRLIFSKQMSEDLGEYFFLDTNQAQEMDIDFGSLWDLVSLENGDTHKLNSSSEDFLKLQSFFKSKTNFDQLRAEASKQILSDINYKPILNDGRNPFSSKINLDEVSLIRKSGPNDSDKVLSIKYKLSTSIEYRNSRHEVEFETATFDSSITIFTDVNVADIFRQISNVTKEQITSDKYSNRYGFESNNSNLYDTFDNIKNLSNFSNIFQSEIKKDIVDEIKQAGEISFDTSNVEFESNSDWRKFIYPDRDYGKMWNVSKWSLSVKDAFTKDEAAFEEAIDQAEEFSLLTRPTQKLLDYLETDQESSKHLNSFILYDNYLTGLGPREKLKMEVLYNKINLDTGFDHSDPEKLSHQRRTIGFIGTYVKNIKATYKPIVGDAIELELPEQFIVNRQLTTFSNTKDLFKQHVRANLLFQKEMLGFNKEESEIAPEDYGNIFELTKPKGFEGDLIPDEKYDFNEIFSIIFKETLEIVNAETKKEGWYASDYIKRFYFSSQPSYFKINDQGYLFLYSERDTVFNSGHWMLTSGTPLIEGGGPDTSHNQTIYFEIGEFSIRYNEVSGADRTFWKFKMD